MVHELSGANKLPQVEEVTVVPEGKPDVRIDKFAAENFPLLVMVICLGLPVNALLV
ncbi:hypothetical protein TUM19329_22290 [Legionella antarctica]|uniref:Uncharacterized protein n=1 Tax=Legionella antarctica TaxID=2708020 RepID=A0A6F8T637_9GAMM|nr:hypothetical protein TUM19329_22290 [Legionella antarctica]